MTTNYKRGRAFEYRVRDVLLDRGAIYVIRAAGSHTKADLVAFCPKVVFFVQCKKNGKLSKKERLELKDLAHDCGAIPFLAKATKRGKGVEFVDL